MSKAPSTSEVASDPSFVVVANRLPVGRFHDEDGVQSWQTSPGGLVTAMEPLVQAKGGAWIGWSGVADRKVAPFQHDGYTIISVELSADEVGEYYHGFSNDTLWPLYHDTIGTPTYRREWWNSYKRVNRRFAEVTAHVAARGATVWVQDYQLQLVPAMLRELRPDLTIGFFLHIPFPSPLHFVQLPWRRKILDGLLGADLIGFQTPLDTSSFLQAVQNWAGYRVRNDRVQLLNGRTVLVRAYPISIDVADFRDLAASDPVRKQSEKFLEDLGHPKNILLGIDRLDYTKGLRERVRAVGELFQEKQLDPQETVFVQVATPSREDVEQYRQLRDDIGSLVESINSEVDGRGRPAVVYHLDTFPRSTMAALYRIADVMLVTPLRDGMNLVAKEYVACRTEESGSLVLSEFAGAALELKDAYLVNPYDIDGMKETILEALSASEEERGARWQALQSAVWANTVHDWATNFLSDLDRNKQ